MRVDDLIDRAHYVRRHAVALEIFLLQHEVHVSLVLLHDLGLDVSEKFLRLILAEALLSDEPVIDDVKVQVEDQFVE